MKKMIQLLSICDIIMAINGSHNIVADLLIKCNGWRVLILFINLGHIPRQLVSSSNPVTSLSTTAGLTAQ